jgi:hypothetical protein
MNNKSNLVQCCIDYCTTTFNTASQVIVNAYKCNSKKLSAAEVWNMQKQMKKAVVRKYGI